VDAVDDLHDVLAAIVLRGTSEIDGETRLVIGLDRGRVIRVVAMPAELGAHARAQLAFHEARRPWQVIHADELYVLDVQAVEKQPDTPGADDPLFLYGVLRGPYPEALAHGVSGIEGQLATTRGELLDGLAVGIERAFVYEAGRCGTSCTHAMLPIEISGAAKRSVVLAFALVPMGEDGSNELIAGELIADVLGAMREDLGDDLADDPVPVLDRALRERELVAAGWTIKGEIAVHAGGKGRLASLFAPSRKQRLPRDRARRVRTLDRGAARPSAWLAGAGAARVAPPARTHARATASARATADATPAAPRTRATADAAPADPTARATADAAPADSTAPAAAGAADPTRPPPTAGRATAAALAHGVDPAADRGPRHPRASATAGGRAGPFDRRPRAGLDASPDRNRVSRRRIARHSR
jgi:hypothetical protein